ncbi:hypothetical protein [Streptacidiphilus rugosus]|uniref:hypothetical protein n=1 Tax=Streptacidiphilus rugosus TaxID=405783 RepID=UPI000567899C|nr:hypothetical protein [Streptacidiphilus rugosus]
MKRHLSNLAGGLATAAGHSVRLGRTALRYLPGWAGAALVSVGAWQAWHPAGFITGGVFLLAMDAMIPVRRPGGEP